MSHGFRFIKGLLITKNALHFVTMIVLLCTLQINAVAQRNIDYDHFKKVDQELLIQDLELLKTALTEAHPGLYRYNSKTSFDYFYSDLKASLDKPLNIIEFYQYVAKMVVGVNDGHTRCKFQEHFWDDARVFPFNVVYIDGQLYVHQNLSDDASIKDGAKILMINSKPVDAVMKQVFNHMSSDGFIKTGKHKEIEGKAFAKYYYLLVDQPYTFDITVENQDGAVKEHDVPALRWVDRKIFSAARYDATPELKPLTVEMDTAKSTAILTINTFMPYEYRKAKMSFTRKVRSTFKRLKREGIRHLVIDLRENAGGEMGYAAYLYNFLTNEEKAWFGDVETATTTPLSFSTYAREQKPLWLNRKKFVPADNGKFVIRERKKMRACKPHKYRFSGNVYILIGGRTFSASALFAAEVRQDNRTMFVGEESGGAYKEFSAGSLVFLTLPNSGIEVQIPLFNLSLDVPELEGRFGRGIYPDLRVKSNLKDWLAGKDPVMASVMEMIRNSK